MQTYKIDNFDQNYFKLSLHIEHAYFVNFSISTVQLLFQLIFNFSLHNRI